MQFQIELTKISVTKGYSDQEVNAQIWQKSQPICYKAKFLQRDNIYLVDTKYNITYQKIREKAKVRPIFIP